MQLHVICICKICHGAKPQTAHTKWTTVKTMHLRASSNFLEQLPHIQGLTTKLLKADNDEKSKLETFFLSSLFQQGSHYLLTFVF